MTFCPVNHDLLFHPELNDSHGGCDCLSPDCDHCAENNIDILFYVNRVSHHTARKDHLNENGDVIVKKGQKYAYHYHRSVFTIKHSSTDEKYSEAYSVKTVIK